VGNALPALGSFILALVRILHPLLTAQKSKVIKAENERLKREKITIYPTPEQVNKLYELIEDFRKRTGVRINQQDLIRRLIDSAESKTVLP